MISRFFHQPIFTGFEPNLTVPDIGAACAWLFFPWKWAGWRRGLAVGQVEAWLQSYFQSRFSFTYDSGRSALFFGLKALGATHGYEVLVQAYTCVVVSNSIRWTGATPVYVDIGADFNLDPADLKKKITPKARVLIIQHTFGTPAQLDQLLAIAKEHNLKVIEDCAHSLGAKYNRKLTGTFGDIGMFSFGSDKVISCVRGGGLITNDEVIAKKLALFNEQLHDTPRLILFTHLLHYIYFSIGKPLYYWGGKVKLYCAKKLHLISHVIEGPEKRGKPVWPYPTKFPNALATILLEQIKHLEENNRHRQELAQYYQEHITNKKILPPFDPASIYLRFPILVSYPDKLFQLAKSQGIFLGDWYSAAIAPADSDMAQAGYRRDSCPVAEALAKQSINLPTHLNMTKQQVQRVVGIVNSAVS